MIPAGSAGLDGRLLQGFADARTVSWQIPDEELRRAWVASQPRV